MLYNVRAISNIRFKMFDLETFPVLTAKLGLPAEDECYDYVPALVFSGDIVF